MLLVRYVDIGIALSLGLTLLGCASTPTVEEVNAIRAKWASDCQAKGYKPGTQDFQTCLSLAMQAEAQKPVQNSMAVGAGLGAASIGLSVLGMLSDARMKRDIEHVATLENGIRLYRFRYRSGDQTYVGVMAQEIRVVEPKAVVEGADGYLRVNYSLLGLRMATLDEWKAHGISSVRSSELAEAWRISPCLVSFQKELWFSR